MNEVEELIVRSSQGLDSDIEKTAFIEIATEFVATLDEESVAKVIKIEQLRKKNNWKHGSLFYKCKDAGIEDCLTSMQEIGLNIPETTIFDDDNYELKTKPPIITKKTEYQVVYGTPETVSSVVTGTLENEGWRIWGPPLPYGESLAQTVIKEEKVYSWKGIDYPYSGEFKALYDRLEDLTDEDISWELEKYLGPLRIRKGIAKAVVEYDKANNKAL